MSILHASVDSVRLPSSSAVMAIAAATLADIYEPHERGTKMGIYYAAPLFGISMGPFLGGVFTRAFGWRAVFWFALISGGVVLVSLFILFKDSFRKERSLSYQNVLRRRLEHQPSTAAPSRTDVAESSAGLEAGTTAPDALHIKDIKLSFMDVNPFPPIVLVLKRWNNNAILLASGWFITERSWSTRGTDPMSGLIFGFTCSLSYTCARTLSTLYSYDALYTGIVLLSNGAGELVARACTTTFHIPFSL